MPAVRLSGVCCRRRFRAADAAEVEALQLQEGAEVLVCEGISLADGDPMALFRSAFPLGRLPDLPNAMRRRASATAALQEAGVADYTRSSTRLTAKSANATQALHLRIPEGASLLRAVSVSIDPSGRPVEYGRTWFAGDCVTLTLSDQDS